MYMRRLEVKLRGTGQSWRIPSWGMLLLSSEVHEVFHLSVA